MNTAAHAHVAACELLVHYSFSNKAFLVRALNASGNPTMFEGQRVEDNKSLVVFGDVAMEARLFRQWLATGSTRGKSAAPPKTMAWTVYRGAWDGIRNRLLSNANLARTGFDVGIQACVNVYGLTAVSAKMMATTVEAIAGAAYLDGGEAALAEVMQALDLTDQRLEDVTALVTFITLIPFLSYMSTLRLLANKA